MASQLRALVRLVLERTAWKDKAPGFQPYADLVKWTDKGAYVSFVDVDKLSLNPQSSYVNPLGVWGYPLTREVAREVMTGQARFGGSRRYVQVFKPKSPGSVLDLDSVTEEQYEQLRSEAEAMGPVKDPSEGSPGDKLWAVTKSVAKANPARWATVFQRLGFDGVLDRKRGIAVFFGAQTLDHLSTLRNPAHRDGEQDPDSY